MSLGYIVRMLPPSLRDSDTTGKRVVPSTVALGALLTAEWSLASVRPDVSLEVFRPIERALAVRALPSCGTEWAQAGCRSTPCCGHDTDCSSAHRLARDDSKKRKCHGCPASLRAGAGVGRTDVDCPTAGRIGKLEDVPHDMQFKSRHAKTAFLPDIRLTYIGEPSCTFCHMFYESCTLRCHNYRVTAILVGPVHQRSDAFNPHPDVLYVAKDYTRLAEEANAC